MKNGLAVMFLCITPMSWGAIHVDAKSTAATPDGSLSAPFKTIQDGISAVATAGEEVLVAPGEYPLTATLSVASGAKKMHIRATGTHPRETVVYAAQGDVRCLSMANGSIFSGFTVSNGFHATQAGGVYLEGMSVLSNCIVTCCRVESSSATVSGGGVYVSGKYNKTSAGTMVVDCMIDGCEAIQKSSGKQYAYGGGLYNYMWSDIRRVTITNCHVRATASTSAKAQGGGLYASGQDASEIFVADGCRFLACTASNLVSAANGSGGGAYFGTGLSAANVLTNSLVRGCSASGDGGGVWGTRLLVRESTLSNNVSGSNGGGLFHNGTGFVEGCVLTGNAASNGGGASLYAVGISNSVLRSNRATATGGGMACGSTMAVGRCLFEGNSAGTKGGGIYDETTPASVIADSVFRENVSVNDGAAVYAAMKINISDGQKLQVRNSLADENVGTSVFCFYPYSSGNAEVHVDGCTIVNNVSTNTALSLYSNYGAYYEARMFIRNTLFAGNVSTATPSAPDFHARMQNVPQNVTYSFLPTGDSVFEEEACHNIVGVANPRFADAAGGDYRLKAKSPCRGAGLVEEWMALSSDHGNGTVIETTVGDYGVSLAFEKACPRVIGDKTNIGCFGVTQGKGLVFCIR